MGQLVEIVFFVSLVKKLYMYLNDVLLRPPVDEAAVEPVVVGIDPLHHVVHVTFRAVITRIFVAIIQYPQM